MKRANGDGGVVYLGRNRKRPYGARITTGKVEGKQKYRYVGYGRTKKDAKEILAQYSTDPILFTDLTFKDVFEKWKTSYFKRNISEKTKSNYISAFNHMSDIFDMPIRTIKTAHMQEVLDEKTDLSKSQLSKIKTICCLVFRYAEENDIVRKNYADFLHFEGKPTQEAGIFPKEEIKQLIKNDGIPNVDIILILLFTGFRASELLAVKKSDIRDGFIYGGNKTAAGKNRAVPIPGIIEKYINDRVQTSKEYLIERDGAQVTYDHFVRFMYYPALKAAGVKKRTPHKARHTFATLMAESGVDTLSIKAIMGHTDYAFTATKYTHIGTDHLRTEITKVKI